MASPLPLLRNEQPIVKVTIDPSAQLKSEEILDQLTALVKIHQDEVEREERISLPENVERKKNQVIRRQVQEQSSFSGQQEHTQSLRNLSLGGIMKDTFADMRDQAMNRFRNNRFVSFARRAGNAYGALTGRGSMFGGSGGENTGELSQKDLMEKREGKSDVKEIIFQLKSLNEKFDEFDLSPEQKKEEGKGFFRTIADAFLGYKLFDFLKNALFGAGVVGAGGLGLKALAGTGMFAGAAAAATKAGAVLAKMGLFGAIAGGLIGTIGDSLIAWSNSENWQAGDISKIIGSILGGTGGAWSAAFRGIAGARAGFLIGSALFPPFGGIIGAFLGGSLGAIAGFIGGQKIAEGLSELGDWFSDGLFASLKDLIKRFLNIFPDPNDERFPKELGNLSESQDVPKPIRQQLDQTIEVYGDSQDRLIAAQKNLADLEEKIVVNVSNMSEEFQQAYRQARVEVRAAQREFEETYRNSKRVENLAKGERAAATVEQNPTEYSPNEKLAAAYMQAEARLIEELRQVESGLEKIDTPSDDEQNAQILLDENEKWFDNVPIVESLLSNDQDRSRQSGNDVLENQIAQEQAKREQIEKELLARRAEINASMQEITMIMAAAGTAESKMKEILKILPPAILPPPTVPKAPPVVTPKNEGGETIIPPITYDEATSLIKNATLGLATGGGMVVHDSSGERNESYESQKPFLLEHLKIEEDFQNKAYQEKDQTGLLFKKDTDGKFLLDAKGEKIPKYAIGYGSSFMPDGREVQKDNVLVDRHSGRNGQLTDEEFEEVVSTEGQEIAAKHMEERMDKFRDELTGDSEYGSIFTGIESQNRRNAILAMLYQMGQPRLKKFDRMFDAIEVANSIDDNDSIEKQEAWDNVAHHMADSDWYKKQTPDRAARVIFAAQNDQPLRDDKQMPLDGQEIAVASAEGHVSYNPEAIVVGDYKGIKNNPEVTIPMSDLEERVLSTVTRMMNIRDDASIINSNVQMINYDSRLKNLLASSEQISKRIQAKDDLESVSRTMTMPPIINSAVDNSKVSTTNQSVIVNRPVENRHNPFLAIS